MRGSNPTVDYKRLSGYPLLLKFSCDGKELFWFQARLGSDITQTLTIHGFTKERLFDFKWYEQVLKKLVRFVNAEVGVVKVSNEAFGKFYKKMNTKYPIGWITYFSNSYEHYIPENLKEVRYEFVDGGKYLYTSDVDFMKDKEAYFGYREKLERIITEIKDQVPDFVKFGV